MLNIFKRIHKQKINIDYLYIDNGFVIVSGWYINKKEKGHIIDVDNNFSLAIDGVDSEFSLITFKRNDLDSEFKPSTFPEHYGFIIKAKVSIFPRREIEVKCRKNIKKISVKSEKRISDLHFFESQASCEKMKFNEFMYDVVRKSKESEINTLGEVCELTSRLDSIGIDWVKFSEENKVPNDYNAINYYVANKNHQEFIIGNDFSTEFYKKTYPDIVNSGVDPLLHYYLNGKNEGRIGSFQQLIHQHYIPGGVKYNADLPTIAIVSHESSATGAPLVGLNLGLSICNDYNVVHIVLHSSSLQDDFVKNSIFTLTHLRNKDNATIQMLVHWLNEQFNIDSIICNSVETYPILEAASELGIPIVSLLHEFSEYTRPKGKITNTIIHSDKVVVPARIIAESAFKEMEVNFGIKNKTDNIVVQPQGKLPFLPESNGTNYSIKELRDKFGIKKEDKVIVGAGYVQTRKGVDLFIDAAFKIKNKSPSKCKFIWVGGGYEPEYDIACSVWLENQLEEYDLKNDFFFLNHQKSLNDVFDLADIYLLTSRLDPFPNVMIDALQSNLPVVCFDRTTGCAEFLLENKSFSSVVPYLNTTLMAEEVVKILNIGKDYGNINRDLVERELCFDNYVKVIIDTVEDSKKKVKERVEIEKVISDSGLFDTKYYGQSDDALSAIKYYVKTALNGIHLRSPVPGFSLGKWLEKNSSKNPYIVPIYENLIAGKEPQTHDFKIVLGNKSNISEKKIAVHLHLYYIDLANEFSNYFSCLPGGFDLYITVCEHGVENKVKEAFSNTGANVIEVINVDNIGRDIAPFFIALKDKLYCKGYDVIGHFHSKKSNDVDQGTGDRWRKYLLSNLIGSKEAINEILEPFDDPGVGLVFAEDSHNIDFGMNKTFSDELCDAMAIERLENANLFPLGTMFWAKPEALSPLFRLNLTEYLVSEPLPYDGSYMHAIERLISHVVLKSEYRIVSVYTKNTNW